MFMYVCELDMHICLLVCFFFHVTKQNVLEVFCSVQDFLTIVDDRESLAGQFLFIPILITLNVDLADFH